MATIKLETFTPGASKVTSTTFATKLQFAVNNVPNGTVIDCTSYTGLISFRAPITITRSVTLLFGEIHLYFTGNANVNMFTVNAPNVKFIGVSRSNITGGTDFATKFRMVAGGRYHIFAAAATPGGASPSGLTIENIDFEGVKSVYTAVSGVANYTTVGAGGIVITEGNPGQPNSNVSNISIKNVHVNSTRHHGIMIYGAITTRLEQCRVRNTAGHGYYITGSSTSVHLDTCYALSTYLSGFCLDGAVYSAMTSCAADNCSLGYWVRGCKAVTLTSCGAEASVINNNTLPNNLGITLASSDGPVTVNDIGSDNINLFKGTNFLVSGGEANALISPYSKDPGNRAGETTYANKRTSHITLTAGAELTRIMTPFLTGTSPVKYKIRMVPIGGYYPNRTIIDYGNFTYSNAEPEPDDLPEMLPLEDIFNQDNSMIYISFD